MRGPDGMSPDRVLAAISERVRSLVKRQYQLLDEELAPELAKVGIVFLRRAEWTPEQQHWSRRHFRKELLPLLQPMGLDPAHPFPRVLNKSLNFIVSLEGKDAFGRESGFAIVTAPRSLPRLIEVPESLSSGSPWVFLSSLIHAHVDELFPGMSVKGCYQFRLTRNSDLFVDEEEEQDLMRALEGELHGRNYGAAVRLEVADNCPGRLTDYLLERFGLSELDLYRVHGPVNLARLAAVPDAIDRPELKHRPAKASTIPELSRGSSIFDILKKQDLLLHHPYQSFAPVVEFLRQAARDPQVLAIKQTLYRTTEDSPLSDALIEAARNGKEVTVVIELRARFDERTNIDLANRLQEAGAYVLYGVVGHKTHAKMILVLRREGRKLRRYVHLGTGNYHSRTARTYVDFGYLSSDKYVGRDVQQIFHQLTGLGQAQELQKLLLSPFTLGPGLRDRIAAATAAARDGKPARIQARMNALTHGPTIRALYEASIAGVKIDLLVRGICCLRPGVPGVSENIRVRSALGRFLEHARIYHFEIDGKLETLLSSADLMDRNLERRVEICWPIEDEELRHRVVRNGIHRYFEHPAGSWELQADGDYVAVEPESSSREHLQELLLLEQPD